MKFAPLLPVADGDMEARLRRAEARLARERAARLEAEAIAERGLRSLYESKQRLRLLQRITDIANRAQSVREALAEAIEIVLDHLGWSFGHVLCPDTMGALSSCELWAGDGGTASSGLLAPRCATPHAGGPGALALASGEPQWLHGIAVPGEELPRYATGIGIPVKTGDEIVAVLEFHARPELQRDGELLAILEQAGVQLGRVFKRARTQEALLHEAMHDPLTGLPNRNLFAQRLAQACNRLNPGARADLAVLVVDLDGFKLVNDSHGHHVGDALLTAIAGAMRVVLFGEAASRPIPSLDPEQAMIARMGGDEFTILVEGFFDPADVKRLARRLHTAIESVDMIAGHHVLVTASIGIAFCDPAQRDVEQLLRDADLAMYEAKLGGRGMTVVFTDALGAKVRERIQMEQELREALFADQFRLVYQPIVSMEAGYRLRGYEALVRWDHPVRGELPPSLFIPVAETSDLILFLGDWVLREACSTAARWTVTDDERLFISVNIAARQFAQPGFARRVCEIIVETGLDPTRLRLELTESAAIQDVGHTQKMLETLRRWGVQISLDDFGTGFSSLSSLRELPFDILKIDRSFISALAIDGKADGIVEAIFSLARTIGLTVVAEGIETVQQANWLRGMGCDLGQGYHFGRPAMLPPPDPEQR